MKRKWSLTIMLGLLTTAQAQTLQACWEAAEQNYPLIRQMDLITKTTDLTVANIGKGWLPQVQATAQATLQSDVTAFPKEMQQLYQQVGLTMDGLKKDQYRVGVDISQTLFDGGAIKSQKAIARQQGQVEQAQQDVSMYAVQRRVNEMYFSLLLLDEQIRLNHDLQQLLEGNEQKLASMYAHGTAAESDHLAVKAERLGACQQLASLESQRHAVASMLSTFCGMSVDKVEKPSEKAATSLQPAGQRPELTAIDAQLRLTEAKEQALAAGLLPRLSLFAQGFYGYPGYNMFEDMMRRRWNLNGMVGARLQWNIGALYTHRNDKAKLQQQRAQAENNREVFLFNNHLEQTQQDEQVERYRQLTATDREIITLRQSVRKAAESKLQHGIIDVNDLLKEINSEHAAQVQQSVHEIQMLKAMFDLKYTKGE